MTFGQTEAVLLAAFIAIWWLFYFAVKMRADQKFLKNEEDESLRPCMGCMVTQSAMLSACTVIVIYAIIIMDLISFVPK